MTRKSLLVACEALDVKIVCVISYQVLYKRNLSDGIEELRDTFYNY